MAIQAYIGDKFVGLSSDVKPTGVANGASFLELDTSSVWLLSGSWRMATGGNVTYNTTYNTLSGSGELISFISGALTQTGAILHEEIVGLSGVLTNQYVLLSQTGQFGSSGNIYSTGSNLYNLITGLSGKLVSSGTNLYNLMTGLSGTLLTLANPTASIGLIAINGVATTAMRSDAAPPINTGISPNWTGQHTHSRGLLFGTGARAFLGHDAENGEVIFGYKNPSAGGAAGNNIFLVTTGNLDNPNLISTIELDNLSSSSFLELTSTSGAITSQIQLDNDYTHGSILITTSGVTTFNVDALNEPGTAPFYYRSVLNNLITPSSPIVLFRATSGDLLRLTNAGSTILGTGRLKTIATDGFPYIPFSSGVPVGVPTAYSGRVPFVYDVSGDNLWFYNGSWKSISGSSGGGGNLTQTGVILHNEILGLSGMENFARGYVTGFSITGGIGITGLINTSGVGNVSVIWSGQYVYVSGNTGAYANFLGTSLTGQFGASGNLTQTGVTLHNEIIGLSGLLGGSTGISQAFSSVAAMTGGTFRDSENVFCGGYYRDLDGGGGIFKYITGVNRTNSGTTFAVPQGGSLYRQFNGPVDLLWFGGSGSGNKNNQGPLSQALIAYDNIHFSSGTYLLSGNTAIGPNKNLIFDQGAILGVPTGSILNISGAVVAGLYQIFSGQGDIKFSICPRVDQIPVTWFGADPTYATESTLAFQRWANSPSGTRVPYLYVPPGTYDIRDTITLPARARVRGDGINSSMYFNPTVNSGVFLQSVTNNDTFWVEGLQLICSNSFHRTGLVGFKCTDASDYHLDQLYFLNFNRYCVWSINSYYVHLSNCRFGATSNYTGNWGDGLYPARACYFEPSSVYVTMDTCRFYNNDRCVYLEYGGAFRFLNNCFEGNGSIGTSINVHPGSLVELNNSPNTVFDNNYIESNSVGSGSILRLNNGTGVHIHGNIWAGDIGSVTYTHDFIHCSGRCDGVSIVNNYFSQTSGGKFIKVDSTCRNVTAQGNGFFQNGVLTGIKALAPYVDTPYVEIDNLNLKYLGVEGATNLSGQTTFSLAANDSNSPLMVFERGAGGQKWTIHNSGDHFVIRDQTLLSDRLMVSTTLGYLGVGTISGPPGANIHSQVNDGLSGSSTECLRLTHMLTGLFTGTSGLGANIGFSAERDDRSEAYMGRLGFKFNQVLAGGEDGYFHIDVIKDSGPFTERVRVDANGNMGIGVIATSKLDVSGQVTIRAGSPAPGRVLTCIDPTGLAAWTNLSANLTGAGIVNNLPVWVSSTGLTSSVVHNTGSIVTISGKTIIRYADSETDSMLVMERGAGGQRWGLHGNSSYFNIRDITTSLDCLTITNAGVGNVGIGTIPSLRFEVAVTDALTGSLTQVAQFDHLNSSINGTKSGVGTLVSFAAPRAGGALSSMGQIGFGFQDVTNGGEDGYFVVRTTKDSSGPFERVRVDCDGNMGIGVVPQSNVRLDVSGLMAVRGGTPAPGSILTCTDLVGNAVWQSPASLVGGGVPSGILPFNIGSGVYPTSTSTLFVVFQTVFPKIPVVCAQLVRKVDTDPILGCDISGVTTAGFWLNVSDSTAAGTYGYNYIATTGSGYVTVGGGSAATGFSIIATGLSPTGALLKGDGTNYVMFPHGTASQVLGVNVGNTDLEYKTITAGSNVTVTPGAGAITISASVPAYTLSVGDGIAGATQGSVLTIDVVAGTLDQIKGTANQVLGMNAAGTEPEFKTIQGGSNISVDLTTPGFATISAPTAQPDGSNGDIQFYGGGVFDSFPLLNWSSFTQTLHVAGGVQIDYNGVHAYGGSTYGLFLGGLGGSTIDLNGSDVTIEITQGHGIDISAVGGSVGMGFFNASPVVKPTVAGSRGGNAALASLITALANLGLVADSTSA